MSKRTRGTKGAGGRESSGSSRSILSNTGRRVASETVTNPATGRDVGVEVKRSTSVDSDGRRSTRYTVDVPAALRRAQGFDKEGTPRLDEDQRRLTAEILARAVANEARARHGDGVGDYKRQHFMGLFEGTMYEDKENTESKMSRQVVGTHASASLDGVQRELASRIEAVLEGQTPQQNPASSQGYGYFSSGVETVEIIVMEEEDA